MLVSKRHFTKGFGAFALASTTAIGNTAPVPTVRLAAYSMRTQWHPIPQIGDWPLDHVGVASSTGTQWGCYGRTPQQQPDARKIAEGPGDELWAREIGGQDGLGGVIFGITGICHQMANRILIPAKLEVSDAPGNEIATPIFGKYGLDTPTLVKRIKDAAHAVNTQFPRRISEAAVNDAVRRVSGGLSDEWKVVKTDIERIIKPKLGTSYETYKTDIERIYLALYYRREALFASLTKGQINATRFRERMNGALTLALEDLRDLIGPSNFDTLVPVPINLAAAYVFYEPPAHFR